MRRGAESGLVGEEGKKKSEGCACWCREGEEKGGKLGRGGGDVLESLSLGALNLLCVLAASFGEFGWLW